MRYLTVTEIEELHARLINQFGGSRGLRDRGALESAITQPQTTFGGGDLYPTLIEKSATLTFTLVKNHPFVDGNKRTGHAAMETFLLFNGYEIEAETDEQESLFLKLAAGDIGREELIRWLDKHMEEIR